jgi:CHAT domain-containing protein/tetratricopeptide (TPR) repeat protein
MIGEFLKSLFSKDFPGAYRPLLAALAELSCSPWKFDVLWDVWPELKPNPAVFPALAELLLSSAESQAEILFGTVVFDDLTTFYDIVGPHARSRPHGRESYRLAYLSIRHMLFRSALDAPPVPPFSITKERYLERLVLVSSITPQGLIPEVEAVLADAAERYRQRGKADGVALCTQNGEILRQIEFAKIAENGPSMFGQQALEMMMSANHVALASEIALQWWPLFGRDFHTRLAATKPGDTDALDGIREFADMLKRLEPFAWLNEQKPGIGSAMATLALLRLNYRLEPPKSLQVFRSTWIGSCQENVLWLKDNWKSEPAIPKEVVHGLLDFFVKVGHFSRSNPGLSTTAGAEPERGLSGALVMADVMAIARRRARNEISASEYTGQLKHHEKDVRSSPAVVEQILAMGVSLQKSDPSFSRAIFEAAAILARLSGNPNLVDMINNALRKAENPDSALRKAEQFEKHGRPDLAAGAWHNVGVSFLNAGNSKEAVRAMAKAWGLLGQIARQEAYVPTTAVFPRAEFTVRIANNYSRALFRCGQSQDALDIVDAAIAAISEKSDSGGPDPAVPKDALVAFAEKVDDGDLVMLHILASEYLYKLHGPEAAVGRLRLALELSLKNQTFDEIAQIYIKFASVEPRLSEQFFENMQKAREFGERGRRLRVYEGDKIELAASSQAAYIWAGESFLERGQNWEALACFEGLRSRALLDLLGLSRALNIPSTIGIQATSEGVRLLDRARAIAYPGQGKDEFGMRAHWHRVVESLDEWAESIAPQVPEYAAIIRGRSLDVSELQLWSRSMTTPTAVVHWLLGEEYSYVGILLAVPGQNPTPPIFRKIQTRLSWLVEAAGQLQQAVRARKNPGSALFEELSRALFAPVADVIDQAEVVYLCPTQALHSIPLAALSVRGEPLNTLKQVSIIPSCSVLRVLKALVDGNRQASMPVVFGPEFPEQTSQVAELLSTRVANTIFGQDGAPTEATAGASLIHFVCHGRHDTRDPWNSGFVFGAKNGPPAVLEGRRLATWTLRSRLAVLEACDTGRAVVSVTDDGFGIGRFLNIAGVPTVLLSEWEVRSDVSLTFIKAFYGALLDSGGSQVTGNIGRAYRTAITETRRAVGKTETFLWAPFTLAGVIT